MTRVRINVTLAPESIEALDALARVDGRDRSHEIEALVVAELERATPARAAKVAAILARAAKAKEEP